MQLIRTTSDAEWKNLIRISGHYLMRFRKAPNHSPPPPSRMFCGLGNCAEIAIIITDTRTRSGARVASVIRFVVIFLALADAAEPLICLSAGVTPPLDYLHTRRRIQNSDRRLRKIRYYSNNPLPRVFVLNPHISNSERFLQ